MKNLTSQIRELLLVQELSVNKTTLSEDLLCDQRSVQRILKRLHEVEKITRISGWIRSEGSPIPIYSKANGKPDAVKPKPLTAAERAALRRKYHGDMLNAQKRWDRGLARITKTPPRFGFWGI